MINEIMLFLLIETDSIESDMRINCSYAFNKCIAIVFEVEDIVKNLGCSELEVEIKARLQEKVSQFRTLAIRCDHLINEDIFTGNTGKI